MNFFHPGGVGPVGTKFRKEGGLGGQLARHVASRAKSICTCAFPNVLFTITRIFILFFNDVITIATGRNALELEVVSTKKAPTDVPICNVAGRELGP